MQKRIRLNKYLSLCGLGSRRGAEELIRDNRVSVNGQPVRNLAVMIDPETDTVTVDRREIFPREEMIYLILFKPRGYITTIEDERNRPIVMDLIPQRYRELGVYPVGRLDMDTEGLLLFTNDGELAHKLNHAKFSIAKEYLVNIDSPLEDEHKAAIEKGIYLHQIEIKTRPANVEILDQGGKYLRVIISEGKKRQIRYTFKNLGYTVTSLRRVAYGPLELKGVHRGEYRLLKPREIELLKQAAYPTKISAGKTSAKQKNTSTDKAKSFKPAAKKKTVSAADRKKSGTKKVPSR